MTTATEMRRHHERVSTAADVLRLMHRLAAIAAKTSRCCTACGCLLRSDEACWACPVTLPAPRYTRPDAQGDN